MKDYIIMRCVLGFIGSLIVIIIGIICIVEGIKCAEPKGFKIGIPLIIVGILGILICISLLKKTKE